MSKKYDEAVSAACHVIAELKKASSDFSKVNIATIPYLVSWAGSMCIEKWDDEIDGSPSTCIDYLPSLSEPSQSFIVFNFKSNGGFSISFSCIGVRSSKKDIAVLHSDDSSKPNKYDQFYQVECSPLFFDDLFGDLCDFYSEAMTLGGWNND